MNPDDEVSGVGGAGPVALEAVPPVVLPARVRLSGDPDYDHHQGNRIDETVHHDGDEVVPK